jgi:hypothetical protein
MPFSVGGFGTEYHGRKRCGDGTFITTKWVVLFALPLIPLSSWHVIQQGSHRGLLFVRWRYDTLAQVALDWVQVRQVYARFAIGILAFILFICLLYLAHRLHVPYF